MSDEPDDASNIRIRHAERLSLDAWTTWIYDPPPKVQLHEALRNAVLGFTELEKIRGMESAVSELRYSPLVSDFIGEPFGEKYWLQDFPYAEAHKHLQKKLDPLEEDPSCWATKILAAEKWLAFVNDLEMERKIKRSDEVARVEMATKMMREGASIKNIAKKMEVSVLQFAAMINADTTPALYESFRARRLNHRRRFE